MSKKDTTKRFIVTFANERTKRSEAATILGVATLSLKNGVEALSSDDESVSEQTLHLDEIGVVIVNLSDLDAESLKQDDRILEIVEDFDVQALHTEEMIAQYQETQFEPNGNGFTSNEAFYAYTIGYQQALLQQVGHGNDGALSPISPFPGQVPTFPFPLPFPRPPFHIPLKQPVPWNMTMVNAPAAWSKATGRGVKVAILDTGIANNHPDLQIAGGVSMVPGIVAWNDDNGHGTHCAGIVGARNNSVGVVGVAPGSSLYAVKVLNSAGSGQLSWILAGMNWAATNKMDIVSMSLGSNVSTPDAPCVVAYQRAAELIAQQGGIVIAAAGNNGRSTTNPWVGQPARCSGFMAVAAVDRNRTLADFSSRGPDTLPELRSVEISAPGVSVRSTWLGGDYRVLSGTSMACPHVAGAAALVKEVHPNWSPAQIRRHLKVTASDLGVPGRDPGFGAGLLDCRRAVQ